MLSLPTSRVRKFWKEKHGFLAFNDIQSDYYQIPSEDKEKIKIAEEKLERSEK